MLIGCWKAEAPSSVSPGLQHCTVNIVRPVAHLQGVIPGGARATRVVEGDKPNTLEETHAVIRIRIYTEYRWAHEVWK